MISVVCVYDNERHLGGILLRSLENQTVEFELITLDNRDGRYKSAAEALNYGGEKAKGDYIMFAHQDMWLGSDSFLEDVEKTLRSIPDLGVAGVAGISEEGRHRFSLNVYEKEWGDYSSLLARKPEVVQTLDECLLLVPRPVFSKLHFDEEVFDSWDCYGADYCLCVARLGLKAYVVPGSSSHSYTRSGCNNIWQFKDLLKYQKRLYTKHKGNYRTIYTFLAEVSWLGLRLRELEQLLGPAYLRLFPDLGAILTRELSECHTVLDLSCGHRSLLQVCNVPFSVGVESFEPYLQETRRRGIHNQYIRGDVRRIEFAPKSFDAVIGLNLFEHLAKQEAAELLSKMEQWARKKVILTTPNGYLRYETYGWASNPLHEVKSGWRVEDLRALGFKVHGFGGWKTLRPFPRLLKLISRLSQKITYHCPRTAFQLMAVKSTDEGC